MKQFANRFTRKKPEDSWQVIYMDLLTNVMIFFVILWTLSQGKESGISNTIGDMTVRMINLPGDVLFPPGKTKITKDGKTVFKKLFSSSDAGPVLNFESTNLTQRVIMIHGHTDSDGRKDNNIQLGFERAFETYQEITKYSQELPDHVVICSHADNTPDQEVPHFQGNLNSIQKAAVAQAKSKNRRISIEDRVMNTFQTNSPP